MFDFSKNISCLHWRGISTREKEADENYRRKNERFGYPRKQFARKGTKSLGFYIFSKQLKVYQSDYA